MNFEEPLLVTEADWQRFEIEEANFRKLKDCKVERKRRLLNSTKFHLDDAKYIHVGLNPLHNFHVEIGIVGRNSKVSFYFDQRGYNLMMEVLNENWLVNRDSSARIVMETLLVSVGIGFVRIASKTTDSTAIYLSQRNLNTLKQLRVFLEQRIVDLAVVSYKYARICNDLVLEVVKNRVKINNEVLLYLISATYKNDHVLHELVLNFNDFLFSKVESMYSNLIQE